MRFLHHEARGAVALRCAFSFLILFCCLSISGLGETALWGLVYGTPYLRYGLRIDASDGSQLSCIPLPSYSEPGATYNPRAITSDGAALWVLVGSWPRRAMKANPANGALLATIELPAYEVNPWHWNGATDITHDGTYLWVLCKSTPRRAYKVNPTNGDVLDILVLPNYPTGFSSYAQAAQLGSDAEFLWILILTDPRRALKVDPSDGSQLSMVVLPGYQSGSTTYLASNIASDGLSLWLLVESNPRRALKVDPETGALLSTITLPERDSELVYDLAAESRSAPALSISTSALDYGTSSTDLAFEAWNSGGGTLSYALSDDRPWISVSPESGTSTGEHDSITVTVTRSGLGPGHYTGHVAIQPDYGSDLSVDVSMDVPDTTPPDPDPMTWATLPFSAGADQVSMQAATATDASGVQYYFDETSGSPGGTDSGWQSSPSYVDTGLEGDTEYCYRVMARDQSANHNETAWSGTSCATTSTPDTSPPEPDPMTWSAAPEATGEGTIVMTASTASDPSGVEYYFEETSGNPGGGDSGWQDDPSYTDSGLQAGTGYCYQVTARDKSVGQNTTAWSDIACAATRPPETSAVFRSDAEGYVFADRAFHAQRFLTGAADVAEWVAISEDVSPGDVLELDPTVMASYRPSQAACSPLVAGAVSTDPGVVLGQATESERKALLALAGIVPVKVTNEGGPISSGDLLVTSSTPGHAMRWAGPEPCSCALVGKALEPMTGDYGIILVLLTTH